MTRAGAHVIEEYSVAENSIECVCGWKGDADQEWLKHRLETKNSPYFRIFPPRQNIQLKGSRSKRKNIVETPY